MISDKRERLRDNLKDANRETERQFGRNIEGPP